MQRPDFDQLDSVRFGVSVFDDYADIQGELFVAVLGCAVISEHIGSHHSQGAGIDGGIDSGMSWAIASCRLFRVVCVET